MNQFLSRLQGCISDLPTPFDENGNIDIKSFDRLCERQVAAGATALVVGEMAGEISALTMAEHELLVRTAVNNSCGRVAIIAGVGSNSTSQAIELTRRAEDAGADAALSISPYYTKPTQAGIYAHFRGIANSSNLPIILHDDPSRTARAISDEIVVQLTESTQFVGLRDAAKDVTRPLRLRSLVRPEFRLLSGDDTTALAYLMQGGDGWISVASNVVPELCWKMYQDCKQGDFRTARGIAIHMERLTACLSRNCAVAPLKYALSMLGLMSPQVRLPLVELGEPSKAEVANAIAALCEEGRNQLH